MLGSIAVAVSGASESAETVSEAFVTNQTGDSLSIVSLGDMKSVAEIAIPFVANPMSAGLPATRTPSNPVFGNDGFLYLFGSRRAPDAVFVAHWIELPTPEARAAYDRHLGDTLGRQGRRTR